MKGIKSFLFIAITAMALSLINIQCGDGKKDVKHNVKNTSDGSVFSVVYIYSDSLIANYALAEEMRSKITAEGTKLQQTLINKQKQFEKDAEYFQKSVNKNALSEQSAQEIYAQLSKNEQELYQLREQYAMQISQKEMEMNIELLRVVNEFLKGYAEEKGYDYILNYSTAGAIFYGNEAFDVTNDVLLRLNAEYNKNKK